MSKNLLDKFTKKVAPFRDLWRSIRVVCCAARNEGAWLVLATRVSLSELPPVETVYLRPTDDFVAASFGMGMQSFGQTLHSIIVDGFVPIEIGPEPIRAYLSRERAGLKPGSAGAPSWFDVVALEHPRFSLYGTERPAISLTAWGERRYDVFPTDSLKEVNSRLRSADPPYDGLKTLLAEWMPGAESEQEAQSLIQIIAPVPFDMVYVEPGPLVVRGPAKAAQFLKVRTFFRPRGAGHLNPITASSSANEIEPDGIAAWESRIEWPKNSLGAKIVLFWNDVEVDSLEINRWPNAASLSAAMNSFFDPEHGRLREALAGRSKVKDSFEMGIVRLLNLLGIPAIWYGRGVSQGRPDLAGLVTWSADRLILLGECTRERPNAKFSGLAQRARELQEDFSNEIAVLPIVFTPAEATQSEFQEAIEHNVSLVGRDRLEMLLRALETGKSREDVLAYLRTMQLPSSVAAYEIGLRVEG